MTTKKKTCEKSTLLQTRKTCKNTKKTCENSYLQKRPVGVRSPALLTTMSSSWMPIGSSRNKHICCIVNCNGTSLHHTQYHITLRWQTHILLQ